MNRIAILAVAAALLALPASAEPVSIRISTVGKTPAQVRAEVFKAAHTLCIRQAGRETFFLEAMSACVESTARATFAQADPSLKLAQK
jgi:hypothetical protein